MKFKSCIREVGTGYSWGWNREFMKLKCPSPVFRTSLIPDFNFMHSKFYLRDFTFATYGIHEFKISAWLIPDFNFINSRFQLHKFINSQFQPHEFTMSTLSIHDFNFTDSRFQLHKITISILWSWNRVFVSWNREVMKMKFLCGVFFSCLSNLYCSWVVFSTIK
jgi:hypothetical protein